MPKIAIQWSVDETIERLSLRKHQASQALLEAVGNAGTFHPDSKQYKLSDYWNKLDVVTQLAILAALAKEKLL